MGCTLPGLPLMVVARSLILKGVRRRRAGEERRSRGVMRSDRSRSHDRRCRLAQKCVDAVAMRLKNAWRPRMRMRRHCVSALIGTAFRQQELLALSTGINRTAYIIILKFRILKMYTSTLEQSSGTFTRSRGLLTAGRRFCVPPTTQSTTTKYASSSACGGTRRCI